MAYLNYTQAIGLERLRAWMSEIFGLSISGGALCNILARAQTPLAEAAREIAKVVTASRVVCCDETSARVARALTSRCRAGVIRASSITTSTSPPLPAVASRCATA